MPGVLNGLPGLVRVLFTAPLISIIISLHSIDILVNSFGPCNLCKLIVISITGFNSSSGSAGRSDGNDRDY